MTLTTGTIAPVPPRAAVEAELEEVELGEDEGAAAAELLVGAEVVEVLGVAVADAAEVLIEVTSELPCVGGAGASHPATVSIKAASVKVPATRRARRREGIDDVFDRTNCARMRSG